MAAGLIILSMAMYGCRILAPIFSLIERAGIGCGRMTTSGCGYRIIHGDGLPFTMDAGSMIHSMAGCGSLVMNGHRLGYRGGPGVTTMVGRRCVPVSV